MVIAQEGHAVSPFLSELISLTFSRVSLAANSSPVPQVLYDLLESQIPSVHELAEASLDSSSADEQLSVALRSSLSLFRRCQLTPDLQDHSHLSPALEILRTLDHSAQSWRLDSPTVISGAADPLFIRVFHSADPSDCTVFFRLELINITKFELRDIKVTVGVQGSLHLLSSSESAQLDLPALPSKETATWDLSARVFACDDNQLCFQVLLEPLEDGEDAPPIRLQCLPYVLPITDFLFPESCTSAAEFSGVLSRLPFSASSNFSRSCSSDDLRAILQRKPLFPALKVTASASGSHMGFLCRSWFGDVLALSISPHSPTVDRVEVRTSSKVLASTASIYLEKWISLLSDGQYSIINV
eukprot:GILI01008594.1.p1 GENE.GILI01008594.1~~GILI01008594.1.p1  ORF type:complete len:393 (+),score=132.00 GILI01008594.1:109-1179(+)